VVTTFFPHGLATDDWVTIAGKLAARRERHLQSDADHADDVLAPHHRRRQRRHPQYRHRRHRDPARPERRRLHVRPHRHRHHARPQRWRHPRRRDERQLGQFKGNCALNIGFDATGIRFVGCDFYDVMLSAVDSTCKIQIVDCQGIITPLYGKGIDYELVDNGVRGTYDSNVQHDPPRMLGSNNQISPAEALWIMERFRVTNAHGDIAPGRFATGSVLRHSRWHHGRDARNASPTNARDRDGVAPGLNPKTAPGPHGDFYQNYDRISITVIGCDLHTNAHAIWFSRAQAGTNYHVVTGVPLTNSGGSYLITATAHGANVNDKILISGTGDATLDNHEWTATAVPSKNTILLGETTYVANRTATVTFVVHYFVDFRRNDMRTTRHWDHTDPTDATHVKNKGNMNFQQTEAWVANQVTMQAKFYDNRWDTVDGPAGSWAIKTPLAGTTIDIGTPNRNIARTYGLNNGFVPGGAITPIFS
jgi:hypothetical protein